jgi:alkanesulfonate monooxygenase SsuD/methylene tetrahydromethanopterin reductase-like flavin-dependent oxidoreductase (luciferase family)
MSVQPVDIGIYIPQVAFGYEDYLERARWVEELGFHSLWLMDHLYTGGAPDIPSFEAWTLASALLASTTRLRVGHMVLCNNFRHPALLGKMATSLDVISQGRLILGLGSGSVASEHREAGLAWGSFAERSERLGESLEIVTRMFASPRTSFEGRHYQVRDLVNSPLPVQRPRPPILVGGGGDRTLELTARYADIWNCVTWDLGRLDEKIAGLHAACERIGRDPAGIRLSTEAVMAVAATDDEVPEVAALAERRFGGPGFGLHEAGLIGTPETIVARLRESVAKGVTLFVFFLHDRGSRRTLELIAERILPELRRG